MTTPSNKDLTSFPVGRERTPEMKSLGLLTPSEVIDEYLTRLARIAHVCYNVTVSTSSLYGLFGAWHTSNAHELVLLYLHPYSIGLGKPFSEFIREREEVIRPAWNSEFLEELANRVVPEHSATTLESFALHVQSETSYTVKASGQDVLDYIEALFYTGHYAEEAVDECLEHPVWGMHEWCS